MSLGNKSLGLLRLESGQEGINHGCHVGAILPSHDVWEDGRSARVGNVMQVPANAPFLGTRSFPVEAVFFLRTLEHYYISCSSQK
jgi:hypothetical protein